MLGLFVARKCNQKREPQSLPCHNMSMIDNPLIGEVTMKKLTQKELKKNVVYDEETGFFYWKKQKKGVSASAQAGCVTKTGYVQIMLNRNTYLAHRLAWLYVYGYSPEQEIDHINRNKSDNRISNLREVSLSCNRQNRALAKNNTTGVTGVRYCAKNSVRPWRAYIYKDRNLIDLGCYSKLKDAVKARLQGEKDIKFNLCNSRSTAYQWLIKEGLR